LSRYFVPEIEEHFLLCFESLSPVEFSKVASDLAIMDIIHSSDFLLPFTQIALDVDWVSPAEVASKTF
jgi:hypothetical protein